MSGYVNNILHGDALSKLDELPDECIDCVITSPPYWSLRKYNVPLVWSDSVCDHEWDKEILHHSSKSGKHGPNSNIGAKFAQHDARQSGSQFCAKCGAWKGELGLEPSFDLYIDHLVSIFNKVQRVLKKEGSCWVVIGDTYGRGDRQHQAKQTFETNESRHIEMPPKTGYPKSLIQIPARFAIKMMDNGWTLRNDIIWQKKNTMPTSVKDRFAVDYEHVYFFTKSQKYYFETQYEPYSEATIKEFGQLYNGQGQKDYEEAGVQNPSDVKRRIIASLPTEYKGKYTEYNASSRATTKAEERAKSREIAVAMYPGDKKAQQQFINYVHEHGMKRMPPIGGIKNVGRDFTAYDRTYSGNTPFFGIKGRLARTVWTINTQPSTIKHYATFPEKLVLKILDAGCPINGVVLDPFFGAGTTGLVALKTNRSFVGIEPNEEYIGYANKRLDKYLNQEKL